MNDIGIGIFCFGDKKYFHFTKQKIDDISNFNIPVYILTDNDSFFKKNDDVNIIKYNRTIGSYHDKIVLHKHILEKHQISIVIDADLPILDSKFFEIISSYTFKEGISYLQSLKNHRWNKELISDIDMSSLKWSYYKDYIKKFKDLNLNTETIWEYFTVIRKTKNLENFYNMYDKLQIAKEYSDIIGSNTSVIGAGEGVSLILASQFTNVSCSKDSILYDSLKDFILPNK